MSSINTYENAIEIKNLTKKYDGFTLDNVSFDVPKGSIMGFIGQNGAGKTTTINSLLNIINWDSGEIRLLGKSGTRMHFLTTCKDSSFLLGIRLDSFPKV